MNKAEPKLQGSLPEANPHVDVYRAARQFECWMRRFNPDFDINASGESCMSLEELCEHEGRNKT